MKRIIKVIENPWLVLNFLLTRVLGPYMNDESFIKWKYLLCMHKFPNLDNPTIFTEKLNWLKLHDIHPGYAEMVDKFSAKEYVGKIIGDEYIIPTFGVWDSFDEIDFDKLPSRFVLKTTHDSGGVVVVRDKSKFDKKAAREKLEKSVKRNFFFVGREYPYKYVKPRILAEKFMLDGSGYDLKDYKFYCFNGVAEYCQLIANRSTDETIDFYDRQWTHQEFIGLNPKAHHAVTEPVCPINYEEMLNVADKLATAISHPFVRIDLYNVNGRVFFGEITFFPASGIGRFEPEEWDLKLGEMIHLR